MIGVLHILLSRLGRRVLLWSSLGLALITAFYLTWRDGRAAGKAAYAIRRAEARVRALQTTIEVQRDVSQTSPADLRHRLERWMGD